MQSRSSQVAEQPSWSSPSASPSPPPPPLPPPVITRWARAEQSSGDSCPHCRGRLASLPTRTTSLSSYSGCKGKIIVELRRVKGARKRSTLDYKIYARMKYSLNFPSTVISLFF